MEVKKKGENVIELSLTHWDWKNVMDENVVSSDEVFCLMCLVNCLKGVSLTEETGK